MFKNTSKGQLGALIGSAALMIAYGLVNTTYGFFIVPVTTAQGFSRAAFVLYYTIMSIVGMVTTPLVGQLIQRIGARKVMLIGCVWGTLGLIGFSACQQLWMFYAVAVAMGLLQCGCTMITAVSVINAWFPGAKRGTPMGIVMSGSSIASVLMGMILPSFLAEHGWRTGYLLQAALWCVLTLLGVFLAGKAPEAAETTLAQEADGSSGEVSGARYSQAMKSPQMYLYLLAMFVVVLVTCFNPHLPAYFVEIGASTAATSVILSLMGVALIVLKISEGWLFDKIGAEKAVLLIFSIWAAAFWVMLFGKNVVALCVGTVMMAVGVASPTVYAALLTGALFGRREFPPIYSIVAMALNLGGALGSPIWGGAYDLTGTYRIIMIVAGFVLLALALLLIALLRKQVAWEAQYETKS